MTVDGVEVASRTEPPIPPGGLLPENAPLTVLTAPSNLIAGVSAAAEVSETTIAVVTTDTFVADTNETSITNENDENEEEGMLLDTANNDTMAVFEDGSRMLQSSPTPFEICLAGTSRTDVARCCINVTSS